jgi:GT2 family glycosyltransferase
MIYIVIPVYNRRHFTQQCLLFLRDQTYKAHRVVVVDDGSTDGTAELLREDFPEVTVVTGNGNLWWAGGTNAGIRYIQQMGWLQPQDFVLMLNDDVQLAPDYLTNLMQAAADNPLCVVGSVSIDVQNPNQLTYAGSRLNLVSAKMTDLAKIRFHNQVSALAKEQLYWPSDCLPGRGMLVPAAVFDAIGLLDEARFQHHMADLDFSMRASKAGFPLVMAASCVVREHTDATGLVVDRVRSFRQFREALSTIRSPINLKTRLSFARVHAPFSPVYMAFDLGRIFGGYLFRRLRKQQL